MQIKTEPRTLRLLMYSFMVLPLSFLCIQICSILLQCQKVRGDSSEKIFALEGDSSYFNSKFSCQNAIPIFSNTVIPHVTLTSILPTLSGYWRTFGGCFPLFMIQSSYLASGIFVWFLSVFSVLRYQLPPCVR